jgi:hypothetical protein
MLRRLEPWPFSLSISTSLLLPPILSRFYGPGCPPSMGDISRFSPVLSLVSQSGLDSLVVEVIAFRYRVSNLVQWRRLGSGCKG